ncbi:winged helix-turn-helix domain-containing protein [Hamadaea tsunoensis]|uniref:winged helix-turn-helix domain-containing protein n=1 Tax=Hamadaea tsunoensis TaxID=53368 RepID=UPI000550DDC1|nr:winged helix-turn-helix domain-containing protein [Hamadaea tsunoensis]
MSSTEIYADIKARINRGEAGYRSGEKLPTQDELAMLYSVHRATIARMMMLLRHDGLVVGRGGAGTFVA